MRKFLKGRDPEVGGRVQEKRGGAFPFPSCEQKWNMERRLSTDLSIRLAPWLPPRDSTRPKTDNFFGDFSRWPSRFEPAGAPTQFSHSLDPAPGGCPAMIFIQSRSRQVIGPRSTRRPRLLESCGRGAETRALPLRASNLHGLGLMRRQSEPLQDGASPDRLSTRAPPGRSESSPRRLAPGDRASSGGDRPSVKKHEADEPGQSTEVQIERRVAASAEPGH